MEITQAGLIIIIFIFPLILKEIKIKHFCGLLKVLWALGTEPVMLRG